MRLRYKLWPLEQKREYCIYQTACFSRVTTYRENWLQRLKFKRSHLFLNKRISPILALSSLSMRQGKRLGLVLFLYRYYSHFLRAHFSPIVTTRFKNYLVKNLGRSTYFTFLQLSKSFYDFNHVLFWSFTQADLNVRMWLKRKKYRTIRYVVRQFQFCLPQRRIYLALKYFSVYFKLTSYRLEKSSRCLRILNSFFITTDSKHVLARVKLQFYRLYLLTIK